MMLDVFMCFICDPNILFDVLYPFACFIPIFNWVVCLLIIDFWEFSLYSGYESFVDFTWLLPKPNRARLKQMPVTKETSSNREVLWQLSLWEIPQENIYRSHLWMRIPYLKMPLSILFNFLLCTISSTNAHTYILAISLSTDTGNTQESTESSPIHSQKQISGNKQALNTKTISSS